MRGRFFRPDASPVRLVGRPRHLLPNREICNAYSVVQLYCLAYATDLTSSRLPAYLEQPIRTSTVIHAWKRIYFCWRKEDCLAERIKDLELCCPSLCISQSHFSSSLFLLTATLRRSRLNLHSQRHAHLSVLYPT